MIVNSYTVPSLALVTALLAGAPSTGYAQQLTLEEALDASFASHPSLSGARARLVSAEEDATRARSTRFPSVALTYGVTRFDEPMVKTPIHAFDPSAFPGFDETLAQGSLGLNYTLFDWGGRRATTEGSDAVVSASVASTRAVAMELIERVATAFLSLQSSRAVDDAARAQVTALEAELDRVRRNLEAGTAAQVEVLRASTALQDALARKTTSEGAARLAERNLARLMGTTSDAVVGVRLSEVTPTDGAGDALAGAVVPGPFVEQALRRADAARARVSVEQSMRLPRLDLTGALLDYGTLSSAHVLEWRAGLQLSWTLFAGGGRRAGVRRAEAELRAAESDVAVVELDVASAIDAARTAVESADARSIVLEAAVEQWRELARVELLGLEAGVGVQRDLLEAQSGLFQAEAGLVGARVEATIARIRLARAQGVLTRAWVAEFLGGSS